MNEYTKATYEKLAGLVQGVNALITKEKDSRPSLPEAVLPHLVEAQQAIYAAMRACEAVTPSALDLVNHWCDTHGYTVADKPVMRVSTGNPAKCEIVDAAFRELPVIVSGDSWTDVWAIIQERGWVVK